MGRTRPLLALIAARTSLDVVEVPEVPWPERVIGARIHGVEVINVHSPTSPKQDLAKVLTHESVHTHLSAGSGPWLVCFQEYLWALEVGAVDRLADLTLIGVGRSRLDVPVPRIERGPDGVSGFVRGCLEDAEAEGG